MTPPGAALGLALLDRTVDRAARGPRLGLDVTSTLGDAFLAPFAVPDYRGPVSTLGNILWFLLAGLWLAIGYATSGILLCLTIVGIPFGIQALKLAAFTLWPFGRSVIDAPGGASCLSVGFNVVWVVLFGWELFVGHLVSGLLLCATIVGIPFGVQAFKLSVLALWPFGKVVVEG